MEDNYKAIDFMTAVQDRTSDAIRIAFVALYLYECVTTAEGLSIIYGNSHTDEQWDKFMRQDGFRYAVVRLKYLCNDDQLWNTVKSLAKEDALRMLNIVERWDGLLPNDPA